MAGLSCLVLSTNACNEQPSHVRSGTDSVHVTAQLA